MKVTIAVFLSLGVSACSSLPSEAHWPGKENEAVLDFIVASELQEVRIIHLNEPIKYLYVNDNFVVVPTRRGDYLVGFRGRCSELRTRKYTADMIDIRVSARVLHSDFDTIRGCKIGAIYELSDLQFKELSALGDAPGQEQYLGGED